MNQLVLLTTDKFLYTSDVETVTLIETRLIQFVAGLLIFYLFCKFVVPAIITYIRSVQIDAIKNQMETNMVKLHKELTDLNETLKQIRDSIKPLLVFLLLTFYLAACDSDRITVYKIRNKKLDENIPATLVKGCDPPCTGSLKCDPATGTCVGTAEDPLKPTIPTPPIPQPKVPKREGHTDLIYTVNKYGNLGEREWKIRH